MRAEGRRQVWIARAVVLVATALPLGCLGVAGNFDIVDDAGPEAAPRAAVRDTDVAPGGDAMVSMASTPVDASAQDALDATDAADTALVCRPGQFQCAGSELQVCNPGQDGWVDKELCGSAALCNPTGGTCTPTSCEKDDTQCSGADLRNLQQ